MTGDNVSTLTFCDADGDSANELLVGSDDFAIRIFQQEEVLCEVSKRSARVCVLQSVATFLPL